MKKNGEAAWREYAGDVRRHDGAVELIMMPPPGTGGMGGPLQPMGNMQPAMQPPGTAMRGMMPPGTAGMMPPGTAMRGMMPPGTGMMPPGTGMGPPGTGMQVGMMGGSVLQQGLKVDDRPVTQQGMGGMKTAGQGPGRQIFDRSYYIGLLRAKQSELNQEIEKIHQKWERLQQDHASFFKLAQRQQTLEDDVKKLQGDLGNYNLMVDKSHTVTDPEEVEREYRALKAVNEKETKKIDVIITERSEIERRARDIDASIKKHQDAVQQKMDELPEEKREKWFALQEEDRQLTTEIASLQSQTEEVRNQVLNEEDSLQRDPLKKQALELSRAVAEKEQEAEELRKATAHLRLSFPEQKKMLLDQVKRDNEEMRAIEEEMKLIKEEVNQGRDRLHEMDTDLAESQGGGQEDNQKKMMDFYEKMQQELGSFAEVKAQEEGDIQAAQTKTVDLLEYISKLERAVVNMPTQQQAADMQDELKFKQQQMEQSQQTVDKMEQELLKVKDEADKLAGIDQKIETEMSQLSQRKEEMKQEMLVYQDMGKLEHDCEEKKQTLVSTKQRLLKQLETLGAQLQSVKTEHEAMQTRLRNDETHTQLTALVKKLGSQEQTVYQLQEYVSSRSASSDYRQTKQNVLMMSKDLNDVCVNALKLH